MKLRNILCVLITCSACVAGVSAKTPATARPQQVVTVSDPQLASKLKPLNDKKSKLQAIIKKEDVKRNGSINGVSPQTMEELNIKQDSICLELRSQLLSVNIEIAELKKQSLTNIVNNAMSNSNNAGNNK